MTAHKPPPDVPYHMQEESDDETAVEESDAGKDDVPSVEQSEGGKEKKERSESATKRRARLGKVEMDPAIGELSLLVAPVPLLSIQIFGLRRTVLTTESRICRLYEKWTGSRIPSIPY